MMPETATGPEPRSGPSAFALVISLALVPAAGLVAADSPSQTWQETDHLSGTEAEQGFFGFSSSLGGGVAVVSEPHMAYESIDPGLVHVFEQGPGGWTKAAQLSGDAKAYSDDFGFAVDHEGETLVVGARDGDTADSTFAGAAYVYERVDGSWTRTAKFAGNDSARFDWFGRSVSLEGDMLAVGAPGDDVNDTKNGQRDGGVTQWPNTGDRGGSVYIFERSTDGWNQTAKIPSPDAEQDEVWGWGDMFGESLALSSKTLLVGAGQANTASGGYNSGAAYVFAATEQGWELEEKIVPGNASAHDQVAKSVDLSADGNTAFIDGGEAVSVFERTPDGWKETATIEPDVGDDRNRFGESLAATPDGSAVLVGAWREDHRPRVPHPIKGISEKGYEGAAYLFHLSDDGWNQTAKITRDDGRWRDGFGRSVALSANGGTALIGAWKDENATRQKDRNSGAAYVYQASPCNEDGTVSDAIHQLAEPEVRGAGGDSAANRLHQANCQHVTSAEEDAAEVSP